MSKDLVTIDSPESGKGQFLVYEAEDGRVKIDVRLEDETVWLTQQLMADLFQTTKQNIGQHLKNIFSEGELLEDSVVKKFFTTAADGKKYKTSFYNLDAIISVGYRVRSNIHLLPFLQQFKMKTGYQVNTKCGNLFLNRI